MDWAEKYRPKHLAELVGNKESVRQMIQWAQTWTVQSNPLLIYGKPGIGKTSSAFALATDMKWEVVELNASDQRTRAVIERIAGTSSNTGSLTGSARKLIILDEADNLQGNSDRGGARAIVEVIKHASQPIILIANDLFGLDPAIRSQCEKVQFRAMQARSITPRLKEICMNEGVSCDISALNDISERAGGDIRSAVTMLYAATIGRTDLTEEGLSTSRKDSRSTIFDLVATTLNPKSSRSLIDLAYEVDETPETEIQWIEGNISMIKDIKAACGAYMAVSRSDEYLGRTFIAQYYTLWRYATAIMLLGVRKHASGAGGFMKIMPPERWKKMSVGKRLKFAREQLLSRLGRSMHMSAETVRNNYLAPVSLLAEQNPLRYAEEFVLDADQLDMLLQDSQTAKATIKLVEEKRKKAERELRKLQKEEAAEAKKKRENGSKRTPASAESKNKSNSTSSDETGSSSAPRTEQPEKMKDGKDKDPSQSTLFSFGG
jgi:replication factor C large subunit